MGRRLPQHVRDRRWGPLLIGIGAAAAAAGRAGRGAVARGRSLRSGVVPKGIEKKGADAFNCVQARARRMQ